MELKKVIKRIVALGTGATMVGATLFGAMAAADLKDYPAPFIKDAKFSGVIAIGDSGMPIDVIGATDIAVGLQYSATKKTTTTTGGSTVTVEGDAFMISASGDDLNLLEPLNSVKDVLDKNTLKALETGKITNDKGTYNYDQYLVLGNSSVQFVKDDQTGGTQDPKIYFKVNTDGNTKSSVDGTELFRFKVSFPTALKSDIDSSRDLDDLDNKKITLLGKEYSIINTEFTTAGKLTLQLMRGAVEDTIEGSKTKTYTIDGKDYEVTLNAVTTTTPAKAQLTINGQATETLEGGQTYTLSDGTQVGIKEVLPTKADGVTPDLVTFYLGAKKIELGDGNSSSGNVAGTFSIGSNDISDGAADLVWSNDTSTLSISELDIAWQPSDNYYIPNGGKVSDVVKASGTSAQDSVDLLNALGIDLQFTGLQSNVVDNIGIHPSGSNSIKLMLKTKSGQQVSEDIWFLNNTKVTLAKDGAKDVAVCERDTGDNATVNLCSSTFVNDTGVADGNLDPTGMVSRMVSVSDEDMFVVETNKYSHLMKIKKFDSTGTKVTVQDVADGQSEDISVGSGGVATFYKDGYQYQLTVDGGYSYANLTQIAGDSSDLPWNASADIRADLWSEHGAKIRLAPNATIIVEGQGVSRDDSTTTVDKVSVVIGISSAKLTPSTISTSSWTYNDQLPTGKDPTISLDSNSNKREALTRWGMVIKQDTGGDQDTIDFEYPEKEAIANVYITAGATTSSSSGGGSLDSVTVNRIAVGAVKLASKISDLKAQNTIIVGGPCVNTLAQEVLGNPAECAAGFEEGKGIIQLWQHTNGNVALLVAGYSGEDTVASSQILANYQDYKEKLMGQKIEVTSATKSLKSVSTA